MRLQSLLTFMSPAPVIAEMSNEEQVQADYKYWRYRTFYSMLFGYALYYLGRVSLTANKSGMISDLGFDKSQIGILLSILGISYGMSKFISGALADKSNPRYFMALGLFLTGLCNIFFGLSNSLWVFIAVWGVNGLFQGMGWPACARSLTNWYSHSERGAWWSSTSVAHNLGAFATPWIVAPCLYYFGWRAGMYIPGIICILGAFALINRMRDAPQTLGLPSVEKFRNDYPTKSKIDDHETPWSTRQLFKSVLTNKYIWILGFAYFFLYILRTGISFWTPQFLEEVKGYSSLTSNINASTFEAGGFFGCLVSGWSSDRIFKAKRGPVCVIFILGILISTFLFWLVPPNYVTLDSITIFLMGFSIFGPQVLIGIFASELSHRKSAATANGFVGWLGYIGYAVSGYPLGLTIDLMGWDGAFMALLGCALICLALLIPLWGTTRATVEGKELKKREQALAGA